MSQDWRGRRIAAVALAALSLVGGCGGRTLPSPSRAAPERDSACATVRLAMPCHAITVDGRMQRYAVVPGEGVGAGDIVLVDLGGPGRSLFGTNDLIAFAAMWGTGRTLVFLEEPWSTTALDPSCRDALSRTYVGWKAGTAGADDLASSCPGLWGWNPTQYTAAAEAVVDTIRADLPGVKVVGTVGISQGAERTSWLWPTMTPAWAVVVSPSPRTRSAAAFIERRTAAVFSSWTDQCPGCGDAAGIDAYVASARSRWAAAPVTIDGRSVPVDGLDAIAAFVAASYGTGTTRRSLATALDAPSAQAAAELGALSDALLMRYGVDDMAVGQLAYFQELCPLYPGWNEVGGTTNEVARLFALVHSPCSQFAGSAAAAMRSDLPSLPLRTCVASTSDDGVTGQESTDEWVAVLGPDTVRVDTAAGQHGALDLAAGCASALEVGGA